MATAPSFGAETLVYDPLNLSIHQPTVSTCTLTGVSTFAVGVLEPLRMYASRISCLNAALVENRRVAEACFANRLGSLEDCLEYMVTR